MRNMKRDRETIMIPQKAMQVSCDSSLHCMREYIMFPRMLEWLSESLFCCMKFWLNDSKCSLG